MNIFIIFRYACCIANSSFENFSIRVWYSLEYAYFAYLISFLRIMGQKRNLKPFICFCALIRAKKICFLNIWYSSNKFLLCISKLNPKKDILSSTFFQKNKKRTLMLVLMLGKCGFRFNVIEKKFKNKI